MKKYFKLLFLLILFLPFMVKADMGAPTTEPYKLVVIDPDGIDYYTNQDASEVKGHIDKDGVFEVTWENDSPKMYSISYNGDNGTITSLEGAELVNKEFNPESSDSKYVVKLDEEKEALVYDKSGVNLLTGPSTVYSKVTSIPVNTKLKYTYMIGGRSDTSYIYTEYKGKKGWVDIKKEKVLLKESGKYIFTEDMETTCGTIKRNTIMTTTYKTDAWSKKALFEINNCKTLIYVFRSQSVLVYSERNAEAKADINAYEIYTLEGNSLFTIPAGSKFKIEAFSDFFTDSGFKAYATYNGKSGWVLLEGDGNFSWSNEEIDDTEEVTPSTEEKKEEAKEEKKEEKKKTKKQETTTKKTDNNKKVKDTKSIVFISVLIGAAVALGALAVILLFNRKGKDKKEEVKEENNSSKEEKEVKENKEKKDKKEE